MVSNQVTPLSAPHVYVIGTASADVLHLVDGQTSHVAGGAGLYTALAVQRAGVTAGLFAPLPDPLPHALRRATAGLHWVGPSIGPKDIPHLEIQHFGQGQATLLGASWGGEAQLTANRLPAEVTQADIIHIAALSTAQRQLEFLTAIRANRRVDSWPRVSVGTYARLVYGDTKRVRQLFELADLFFMNENEAAGLFGSVAQAQTRLGALLFVTLDVEGALVIEGQRVTHVPGQPVAEVDPTGAGDTFCGATLAGLTLGKSPLEAAQVAVQLAAQTVSMVGPAALIMS